MRAQKAISLHQMCSLSIDAGNGTEFFSLRLKASLEAARGSFGTLKFSFWTIWSTVKISFIFLHILSFFWWIWSTVKDPFKPFFPDRATMGKNPSKHYVSQGENDWGRKTITTLLTRKIIPDFEAKNLRKWIQ